ncbi:unnamed protein product [Effrenium voratum]|nr:unnamed protein product [Effrenium voratum]
MSQLEMISEAPVACSVIKALRHKNANISFISEVCKSAGLEGSKKQATLSLGTVQTERTFHSRLRRDLPVVSTKEVSLKIGQRICKRRVSFVLLSSYLAWLWKRPKVRNLILYGQTTSEERCAFIAQLNKAPHMPLLQETEPAGGQRVNSLVSLRGHFSDPPADMLHTWLHMWLRLRIFPINPKINACFGDEDLVRRICDVASGCHHRGTATNAVRRFLCVAAVHWITVCR